MAQRRCSPPSIARRPGDRGVSAATSAPGIPQIPTQIDRETPPALELHLIVDNYSTHKHEQVKKWLAKHPRFHFHFIPTSSSWLNLVERWFRGDTEAHPPRRVPQCSRLEAAIHEYLEASNQAAKPFVWTAPAKISSPKSSAPPKPTPLSRTVSGTTLVRNAIKCKLWLDGG